MALSTILDPVVGNGNTSAIEDFLSSLGITGNQAGMGLYGILGALASLNQTPEVGTKQTSESKTGSTTIQVGQPQWYEDLMKGLGTEISGANGSWSDLGGYMTGGTGSVADADLSRYMNPYIDSVLQPQITRMNEDFTRGENARRAKAGMVGAFGGSRDILEGSLASERHDKALNEATANAFSNAFGNAQNMFGQDRTAQQWGAGMTGNLFGLLKPGQTTSVSATAGDTSTTMATGSKPNTFGDMANLVRNLWGMGNPPVPSVTTTSPTTVAP